MLSNIEFEHQFGHKFREDCPSCLSDKKMKKDLRKIIKKYYKK